MINLKEELTSSELKLVADCLSATVNGSFFPDWEFETLFGVSRSFVDSVRQRWPNIDAQNAEIGAAVIGSLNNLLGYPQKSAGEWSQYISASDDDVRNLLKKLQNLGL
ncbi:MAG: hypothetical protein ABUL52_01495 [Solimonas sp.]